MKNDVNLSRSLGGFHSMEPLGDPIQINQTTPQETFPLTGGNTEPKSVQDMIGLEVLNVIQGYCIHNSLNIDFNNMKITSHPPIDGKFPEQPFAKVVGKTVEIRVHPSWLNGTHNLRDIRDGLIFELFNFPVVREIDNIQRQFQNTTDSLFQLGQICSNLEAGTVFHSSQIYQQLGDNGYSLSIKAAKQLIKAHAFAPNNALYEYEDYVRTSRHEQSGKGHMGLTTPALYQFNYVALTGGTTLAKKVKAWIGDAFTINNGHSLDYNKICQYVSDAFAIKPLLLRARTEEEMQKKVFAFNELIHSLDFQLREISFIRTNNKENNVLEPLSNNMDYQCLTF